MSADMKPKFVEYLERWEIVSPLKFQGENLKFCHWSMVSVIIWWLKIEQWASISCCRVVGGGGSSKNTESRGRAPKSASSKGEWFQGDGEVGGLRVYIMSEIFSNPHCTHLSGAAPKNFAFIPAAFYKFT